MPEIAPLLTWREFIEDVIGDSLTALIIMALCIIIAYCAITSPGRPDSATVGYGNCRTVQP